MKYYVNVSTEGTFWYKDPAMTILHRENGPACEFANGTKYWYLNGVLLSEAKFNKRMAKPEYFDRSDAVNTAMNVLIYGTNLTPKGIKMLCQAILDMDKVLTKSKL